jgi:hypothetical protein
MRVRIISFGSNWWAAHSNDMNDPYRYSRKSAWFNSAGLKYGQRLRFCWVVPGQIRFNRSSGFNPEFKTRTAGKTFECDSPRVYGGRIHLLVTGRADNCMPDACLVTLTDRVHGGINFDDPGWRSPGVKPISVSLRPPRYEAMVLMGTEDFVRTETGEWQLAADHRNLVATIGIRREASWDISRAM